MQITHRSRSAAAEGALRWHLFGELASTLFRAAGALGSRADQMMPAGLTVARWQVLKAVLQLQGTATVPGLSRSLSLSRQAVQKQVDGMLEQKLVTLTPNPAHRRSPVVALTKQGHDALLAGTKRWTFIAQMLGDGLDSKELQRTHEVLLQILRKLEAPPGEDE